jgi:DNA-binding phage protein
MTRRSKGWDQGLAEDLRDQEFAREFIIASIEEGMTLQDTLGKVIRCYGVKEFAKISGLAESNILRTIDSSHNPTQKTLSELLRPFGLRISVAKEVA